MIKLDEHLTREEFEGDLLELIDEHKKETRHAMEKMLAGKGLARKSESKIVVRDISLSELKDADRLMARDAATDILARYISIHENLQARSPANVDALRAAIGEQSASHLLAPWSEEMMAAIADQDFRPWIRGDILLMVDFPADLQEERKIRAKMHIGETSVTFPWAEANSTGHYELGAEVEDKVFLKREQRLELELVQDRG